MNPYQVLGLTPEASAEDIKKAYRKLAMAHHPDKVGDTPEAKQKMQVINAAYDRLKDPASKAAEHSSESRPRAAGGFEKASPKRKSPRSHKAGNCHSKTKNAEDFFAQSFESAFGDMPNFKFEGTMPGWQDYWAKAERSVPRPSEASDRAQHGRTKQTNKSPNHRNGETNAARGDTTDRPEFRRSEAEARSAPVEEQFEFYKSTFLTELAKTKSSRGAARPVVPGYIDISRRVVRASLSISSIKTSLSSIKSWLVDVADFDQASPGFLLANEACADAARTNARFSNVTNVTNALTFDVWESRPKVVECLAHELLALHSYLEPLERLLQDVKEEFCAMSKSTLARHDSFNLGKRNMLWTALRRFRAEIALLEKYRGARFTDPEYRDR